MRMGLEGGAQDLRYRVNLRFVLLHCSYIINRSRVGS